MSPQSYCPSPDTPEASTGPEIRQGDRARAIEAALRAALLEAIEELECGPDYSGDYYVSGKYIEVIERLRAVLENS